MWLGDTATAERVANHLKSFHAKVEGDIIDVGEPALGGYAANSARDSMWAAMTEMHSMLWVYEAFAFRGWRLPRRLPDADRDRFISESAAYVRLFGVPEVEIPTNMSQLRAFYRRDAALFAHSNTINTMPQNGKHFKKSVSESMRRNFNRSHFRIAAVMPIQHVVFGLPTMGALSKKTRASMGIGPIKEITARIARRIALPLAWLMQRRPIERYFIRLMWGPDAIILIESARALHRTTKAHRRFVGTS